MNKIIPVTLLKLCLFFSIILWLNSSFAASITETDTFDFTLFGIKDNLLQHVKSALDEKKNILSPALSSVEIKRFHQAAPNEILKALQPYGYFKPSTHSQLSHVNHKWQAIYYINPGPTLKIKKLNLLISGDGANLPEFRQLKEDFAVKAGQVFNVDNYNKAKNSLFSLATALGYLDGTLVDKKIVIDLVHYDASITLHFDTGQRYYFGNIKLGSSLFDEGFLKRFFNFTSGEVYSQDKIEKLRDILNNSGLFKHVEVEPQIAEKHNQDIPVTVKVVPLKAKQYNFGLGYGTDTGARGLLGVELRHVTATGQKFNSVLKMSQVKSNLSAHYLIPGNHPATDQYDLNATIENQDQDFGKNTTMQVGAAYISQVKGWQQTLKLNLLHERYRIGDDPSKSSLLLLPGINWSKTVADEPITPDHGYYLNLNVIGASRYMLSSTSFLQTRGDAKYVRPLLKKLQLVLRGSLGYTAISHLENLPLSLQYFTGGIQNLRGYNYNSIGPGQDLTVGSVELRYEVIHQWYGIAFLDAGNVSSSVFPPLKKGAGIGVLWRSPIGLAQLIYARALDVRGKPNKIQFSIGPEF